VTGAATNTFKLVIISADVDGNTWEKVPEFAQLPVVGAAPFIVKKFEGNPASVNPGSATIATFAVYTCAAENVVPGVGLHVIVASHCGFVTDVTGVPPNAGAANTTFAFVITASAVTGNA